MGASTAGLYLSLTFSMLTAIPVSRRIGRRPRKNFGLAAVPFPKPPAADEKKSSAKPPVQRRLILPMLTTSDKFNICPVEKTKYCRKISDPRHDCQH